MKEIELRDDKINKVKELIDETSEKNQKDVQVTISTVKGKDGISRTQYTVRIPRKFAEEMEITEHTKFRFKLEITAGWKLLKGQLI